MELFNRTERMKYMDDIRMLKSQAMGVIGRKRTSSNPKPDPTVKLPDPTEVQSDDTLVVLHSNEMKVILDLLYDGLTGSKSNEDKKAMLSAIKHLEGQ